MTSLIELQKTAKSLGLPYSRRTVVELERAIAEYKANPPTQEPETTPASVEPVITNDPVATETQEQEQVESETTPVTIAIANTKDGNEVRRFELSIHGEGFGVLAKEFANKNGYTVEFK